TRLVELAAANLARLGDVHPARAALTLGMATIRAAGCLALVAAGEGKAAALGRLLDGPVGDDCPVTHLRHHPSLTVFA
ncbi:MAG: glucosamine-6-phosphate deaminase, partial [Acidimicrobiia bacterium]